MSQTNWGDLVAQKRRQGETKIPAEWRLPAEFLKQLPPQLIEADVPRRSGILTLDELNITENYTAGELVHKLAKREVSSVAVTTAFSKRAAIAQQLTSCLTETFFPQALERARYLDEYLNREGKPIGPLHGLPVSLKDCFCVEGVQTTLGYVSFLGRPVESKNSALVSILLELGAVLYVKTNIPQTMMTAESDNHVFGRTLNPNNINLGAGGSSGGEGALVAFRGSILGVGTDVAGSVRIPSICCGVYGFRPTSDRIPYGGMIPRAVPGLPGIRPVAGPLAKSVNDLELFMGSVINTDPWRYDSNASSTPWKPVKDTLSPLIIGILPEDPDYPLHQPVRRALQNATAALAQKGHRIVNIPHNPTRSLSLAGRIAYQYFFYGPPDDRITSSGEPEVTSVALDWNPMFTGPAPAKEDADPLQKISQLFVAQQKFRDAWRDAWLDLKLDVVLAPGSQSTAVPHDTYGWPAYTVMWNVLDYPACIVPYGQASKELDPEPMMVKDKHQPSYKPEAQHGMPTSIQIVARHAQDEKCLWAVRIIEDALRD